MYDAWSNGAWMVWAIEGFSYTIEGMINTFLMYIRRSRTEWYHCCVNFNPRRSRTRRYHCLERPNSRRSRTKWYHCHVQHGSNAVEANRYHCQYKTTQNAPEANRYHVDPIQKQKLNTASFVHIQLHDRTCWEMCALTSCPSSLLSTLRQTRTPWSSTHPHPSEAG